MVEKIEIGQLWRHF